MQNKANYHGWAPMTSFRQIEANRRNAGKSTGPITEEGKQRSRCNAVRHGLTAETVIGTVEDAEDYKAFEAAIIADYDVQSAVERELVLRLVSLLWRLRRASTMETGLFEIQADYLRAFGQARQTQPKSQETIYARFGWADSVDADPDRASHGLTDGTQERPGSEPKFVDPAIDLARCFLRLANLPSYPLDRLAGMKQSSGARRARFYLLSMRWIVVNHTRDGTGSVLVSGKTCQPTSAKSLDFRVRRLRHGSTRQAVDRNNLASRNSQLQLVGCLRRDGFSGGRPDVDLNLEARTRRQD